jgi:hypothetical protein
MSVILERRSFSLVCVGGGLGGLLFFLEKMQGVTWQSPHFLEFLVSVFSGSFASVIFLFVVVNTDRADWIRLASYAALCGYFHTIVIEAGGQYIGSRKEEQKLALASGEVALIRKLVQEASGNSDKVQLQADLQEAVGNLNRVTSEIDSLSSLRRIAEELPSLGGNAEITPILVNAYSNLSAGLVLNVERGPELLRYNETWNPWSYKMPEGKSNTVSNKYGEELRNELYKLKWQEGGDALRALPPLLPSQNDMPARIVE